VMHDTSTLDLTAHLAVETGRSKRTPP
jgi:hypothetical protein